MKKLNRVEQLARLEALVDRRGPDECWPFTGRWHSAQGYGLIRLDGKCTTAHRALYLLANDKVDVAYLIPVVRHTCDNPPCCNLAHLISGTHKENAGDMISRGRKAKRHRPHTRVKKLTDDQVRAIRGDKRPLHVISYEYRISESVVSMVRRRKAKQLVPD